MYRRDNTVIKGSRLRAATFFKPACFVRKIIEMRALAAFVLPYLFIDNKINNLQLNVYIATYLKEIV